MAVRGFQFVADPVELDLLINFHTQVAEQIRGCQMPALLKITRVPCAMPSIQLQPKRAAITS
jgi:hypothetical protein